MAKPGPKPYKRGNKLMPICTTAERLGIDPRTVHKLWNVVAQVESLKEQLETEQDATANAMDRLAEVQEELTATTKGEG